MQKHRADKSEPQPDGATAWYAQWMGGNTLARIDNCRIDNLAGEMRRTVYITGEADSYFSIPAVCKLMGARVKGYVTGTDTGMVFRAVHHD